jgi:toxin FitB
VTRYLLDSNILSNVIKPAPSEPLLTWLSQQDDEDLFIGSWTIAEIWRGVLELPNGGKRAELESWYTGPDGPPSLFARRILSFDAAAAMVWARLMSDGVRAGRPRSALDMIIAGIAEANDCVLVTDNEKHFTGLNFINPMRPKA